MKRFLHLLISTSLLTGLFFVLPSKAQAVSCLDWSLYYADMESYYDNAVQTVRNPHSLSQIAVALSTLEGFPTYVPLANDHGLFQSSTGAILAQDGVDNQWQSYMVYTLYNTSGDVTVLVWTHPDMPNRAYWFFLSNWETSGQFHACKAIETPMYVADQVWADLSGLQP